MDIYHAWFDLKPDVSDASLADAIARYMGHLQEQDLIAGWRLTRRKLGLGIAALGEFRLMIDVRNLVQLEAAFTSVGSRREPVEGFHFGVNSLVRNAQFALYRDFPDSFRHRGEERF